MTTRTLIQIQLLSNALRHGAQVRRVRCGFDHDEARPATSRVKAPGFTLIEMVLVMAIIGLAAAMLFPAYTKVVQRTKIQRATVEAGHVATAFRQYYADRGRWPMNDWCRQIDWDNFKWFTNQYVAAGLYSAAEMRQIIAGSNDIAVGYMVLGHLQGAEYEISTCPGWNQMQPMGPWLTPDPKSLQVTNYGAVAVTNLLDSFGNVYQVRFDLSGRRMVLNPFDNATWMTGVSVIVWSAGPDGKWTNNNINAAVNRDNIKSW